MKNYLACCSFPLMLAMFLCSRVSLAAEQPNILFIFCDDLTNQAISSFGDERKLLDTPHIDRLAAQGMKFSRCLVPNSICGPSRATILTGKYSHLNGFYSNESGRPFDGSQQTFPKLLQQTGYQTALIGKWHLMSDPTGFDHWHILPGQGIYYNPPMIRNGERVKHEGYTTDLITDFSIEWLENRDKSKPFLLMSQHKAPHREWAPALRHLGWNGDRRFPEPQTLFDKYDGGRGLAWRDQDMSAGSKGSERRIKGAPDQRGQEHILGNLAVTGNSFVWFDLWPATWAECRSQAECPSRGLNPSFAAQRSATLNAAASRRQLCFRLRPVDQLCPISRSGSGQSLGQRRADVVRAPPQTAPTPRLGRLA